MKERAPYASDLWNAINNRELTEENLADLSDFRSNVVNFRLALYDPATNGPRYLKSLIYALCSSLEPVDWERLRNVSRRDLGSPITVEYMGADADLDYVQAVLELRFILSNVEITGEKVLEIGAGYGRTCHAILSNAAVSSYWILDLPNALTLSHRYLRAVLDEDSFKKVRFISTDDFAALREEAFHLAVNIDSMAEMAPDVVHLYLDYIADSSRHFYVKNPVGKYVDESRDRNHPAVAAALATGPLRDTLDIYSHSAITQVVPRFIEAYRPSDSWRCLADSWAPPWSYYWQACYERDDARVD